MDKKSWSNAQSVCQLDGANLATITDGFEQGFMRLITYIKSQSDPWIGLKTV